MNKKIKLFLLLLPMTVILAGCAQVSTDSTGLWNDFTILFARIIVFFSGIFFSNIGLGIIVTTIIIRVVMIPLYSMQNKSTMKMQRIQPQINKINDKYQGKKDAATKQKQQQELSALYSKEGVNPLSGCLPLLLQLPILIAFYESISYLIPSQSVIDSVTESGGTVIYGLKELGVENYSTHLFGLNLGDPVIIFAVIAAVSSYFITVVTQIGQDPNAAGASVMKYMKFVMPAMILFFGLTLPGALSVYWIVGNVITIGQTLFFKRSHIQTSRQQKKMRK